ncbi:hypothetical protein BGZ46_001049 [Entomortierella lignicola]|nr:hypothetical protein BGZ46_001049 [Entomortierella lignicola]
MDGNWYIKLRCYLRVQTYGRSTRAITNLDTSNVKADSSKGVSVTKTAWKMGKETSKDYMFEKAKSDSFVHRRVLGSVKLGMRVSLRFSMDAVRMVAYTK